MLLRVGQLRVHFLALSMPEVMVISPRKHGDSRGFFSQVYNKQVLANAGIDIDFVQDNHAFSTGRGTVRGLRFQSPPLPRTSWCA